ncbi:Uncharacterized protein Adt_06721 [Abeliophyllum distichum]|uniref:Transposase MuDR plant domain-containing protein n=1 Tax=Abeliophyllum distichum TaxID=126358 RepID=A0ABD1V7Q2_9LAMI
MLRGDYPAPDYGEYNTEQFTIRLFYGGCFLTKDGNTVYEGGKVDYIDNCYASYFSTFTLDRVMNVMKIPLPMGYSYKRSRLNLNHGLMRLATDQHVAEMLEDIGPTRTIDMYLIPPHVPKPESKKRKGVVITNLEDGTVLEPLNTGQLDGATEAVNLSSDEEMSSKKIDEDWDFNWMGTPECHVVITELDKETEVQHDKCDIRTTVEQDVNIATEFEPSGVEPEVDETNLTTGVQHGHASPGQYHENIDFNWDEPIFNESDEGDYNADKPLVDQSDHIDFTGEEPVLGMVGEEQPTEHLVHEATEQPDQQATNHIDCNWDEPAVENVHSDYGLSDELESLNSDEDTDEPCRRVREPIFNTKTDMSDPRFALGMIFETVQVLRAALVEYSIKNGRPLHYVKNDTTRVRMRCKHPCPWEIYAAVQEDKLTFKVNKLVDNHTCAVVSKNRWATSSYLSKKFEGGFRSNPE